METVFIYPLFAPTQEMFNKNLRSLVSWFDYCDHYGYKVKFAIGGWCADQYWQWFSEVVSRRNPNDRLAMCRFDKNYGKAVVVNTLYKQVEQSGVGFKYILTADSDIVFPIETANMIERLEELAVQSVAHRGKPFGLCGFNLLEFYIHLKALIHQGHYEYVNSFGGKEIVVYPNTPGGLAGSCLFMSREAWQKACGYRVMGVYAGDDAYILVDMDRLGYSLQVADTISVIHPYENDKQYAAWKLRVCQRETNGIVKQDISGLIDEANVFWNSK